MDSEDLSKYTPIELLKLINDSKSKHDELKKEITDSLSELDKWENLINGKIELINEVEKKYVLLMEEFNKRK